MSIVSKLVIAQCTFSLASRLPLRYALRSFPCATLARCHTSGRADWSRQSYNTFNRFIRNARYSTDAHSLAQSHLPLHVCNSSLRQTASGEGCTNPAYTKYSTMASSVASNTSSGKRKRGSSKFYAVRVGRKPGIYQSWPDCEVQVKGVHSVCRFATKIHHFWLHLMYF
jgi:hypothetical protein